MNFTEYNYLILDDVLPEKKLIQESKTDIDPCKVIEYLSQERVRNLPGRKPIKCTHERKHMVLRLIKKGHTRLELKNAIDSRIREWKGTEYEKHIMPETIFRPSNFMKYAEAEIKLEPQKNWME